MELEYMVRNRWHKGSVQDISEGGAYIRSSKRHSPGEDILLAVPLRILGDQLRGKIIWVRTHGMGVKFHLPELAPLPDDSLATHKESKSMGKVKDKKIRWEPSTSEGVKYRLYWSIGGGVDYHSDHADLGNVTEINLPSDIPAFPLISRKVELGISAISEAGNESELTKLTVHVDFAVPEAPKNLRVEDV